MNSSESAPGSPPRRKATLFCPDCGHESPLSGDWVVRTSTARRTTTCPTCGSVVDERPRSVHRPAGDTPRDRSPSLLRAAATPARVAVAVQHRLLGWWAARFDCRASSTGRA